jgi:hypothetical protein
LAKQLLSEQEVHGIAERIDALVQQLALTADPEARAKAQELVRLVMQMYGAALARIVALLEKDTVAGLLADDLIASLLVLHDLHPHDAQTRIEHGLARVATLTGVEISVLRADANGVRVQVGTDRPAHATAAELKRLIEGVVHAATPDVTVIDVEGLAEPPVPLVQLTIKPSQPREQPISFT